MDTNTYLNVSFKSCIYVLYVLLVARVCVLYARVRARCAYIELVEFASYYIQAGEY